MVNKKDNKEVNEKVQTKVSDEQILDDALMNMKSYKV